jgi:hypothetical protein
MLDMLDRAEEMRGGSAYSTSHWSWRAFVDNASVESFEHASAPQLSASAGLDGFV